MPYSIQTKDGIKINNIPDDLAPDSQELKDRVAQIRAGGGQQSAPSQPSPMPSGAMIGQSMGQTAGQSIMGGIGEAIAKPFSAVGEMITGSQRETDLTKSLPELQSSGLLAGESGAKTAAISPALLTSVNPNEIAQIITSNFPNVGVVYNKDAQGNVIPILRNNETGAATVINKPGVSGLDVVQALGIGAALFPAAKGANVTAKGLGAMAAKGAATQAGIEGVQAASGGEFNPEDVLITAAALPAGQVAGEKLIGPALRAGSQKAADFFTKQGPFKEEIKRIITEGGVDNKTARYIINGAGKVEKDPLAMNAIKQGYDEGLVAAIKGSSQKDRQAMAKMIQTLKTAKGNARFAAENRPADVVGDSVVARFQAVKSANRDAGSKLDEVAASLKGQPVEYTPAVSKFMDDLDAMGITIGDDLRVNFSGSDIEGLPGPENAIKNIVRRMQKGDKVDAYDVHRMKKFIDEQVTYGKTAEGLSGKTESILKSLRRNLDQTLDDSFPRYNQVNTKYSDTIQALDAFKSVAGKSFDPLSENASKQAGTLSRRLLSNTQSRVALMDSLGQLQSVASKYGASFDDDIITQAMFADELASMFGAPAKTSFEGGIEKSVKTAVQGARRGPVDIGLDLGEAAIKKARGVNEENAIKAMESLLKR